MSKNKAKKSFVKPAIGAVAALALIGAFVPSEESPNVEETTPPAIVQEVKKPDKTPVENPAEEVQKPEEQSVIEIDPEQAFREKLNQYNYVGSSESDKYHKPKCRWTDAINDLNLVHFETEEEADAAGYQPCGTCKP